MPKRFQYGVCLSLSKFGQAEIALSQLLGLPLVCAGAAGTLLWVHFGDEVEIPNMRGGTRKVGAWALHIDCPWRITGLDGVVTGSGDYWEPPVLGKDGRYEDFDAYKDRTRFDIQIRKFVSEFRGSCVGNISVDSVGGFRLSIGRWNLLEVFPINSQDIECWRLFQPDNSTDHFVVTGIGTSGPCKTRGERHNQIYAQEDKEI